VQWDKVQDFDGFMGEKIKEVELKINQFSFTGTFKVHNTSIRQHFVTCFDKLSIRTLFTFSDPIELLVLD